MGWVDLVLLGLLGISVLLGLWRGLVFEILSIAGWVVAYLGAGYLSPWTEGWLPAERMGPALTHGASLVLGFVLILLVWGLAAKLLRSLIHATPLSAFDRLGGAGFGVLRGVLIAMLVVVMVSMTPAVESVAWRDSQLAPWLQALLHGIRPVLPAEVVKFIPV